MPRPGWEPPSEDWQPPGNDLISGAAGVGLGHLELHELTGDARHLGAAVRCGQIILASPAEPGPVAEPGTASAIDTSASRAHGLAGELEVLLALAARTGDQATLAAAAASATRLVERTEYLLPAARAAATPLTVSWCQGLAGIGQVLLAASRVLDDPGLASLARRAADVCVEFVPRLSVTARCCGLAGLGHFFIDLALAGSDERYWDAARDTGRQMLLRSGGPSSRPVFTPGAGDGSGISWAFGLPGLLSFFRRLARPGDDDSVPGLWKAG